VRVAVIGAGFAGLAAAERLAAKHHEVVVLEARDRVGGRVWSQTLANGTPVEMGAEFITEGYEVLPATASRLGIEQVPMGISFGDREPRGGGRVDRAQLLADGERVAAAVEAGEGDGLTVTELLDRLSIAQGSRELIACRVAVSYAHPAERIEAGAVRDVAHLFDQVETHRLAGGNDGIARALARGLDVRCSSPVTAVEHDADGVVIDGELRAHACVIAVPAHVPLEFRPALPQWKIEALRRVVYGQAAKLFAPLQEPAQPSAVMSVPGRFWTWTATGEDGSVLPAVNAFAGSGPAVSQLLEGDAYLDAVSGLRPDLRIDAAAARVSTWPEGAYSTVETGRPEGDAEALAAPVGRLAFAGEHTAGHWFATMEGALRSGHRAAADILTAAGP
jgi:predicted NAD/FAD-dependent oxidoreductase